VTNDTAAQIPKWMGSRQRLFKNSTMADVSPSGFEAPVTYGVKALLFDWL